MFTNSRPVLQGRDSQLGSPSEPRSWIQTSFLHLFLTSRRPTESRPYGPSSKLGFVNASRPVHSSSYVQFCDQVEVWKSCWTLRMSQMLLHLMSALRVSTFASLSNYHRLVCGVLIQSRGPCASVLTGSSLSLFFRQCFVPSTTYERLRLGIYRSGSSAERSRLQSEIKSPLIDGHTRLASRYSLFRDQGRRRQLVAL